MKRKSIFINNLTFSFLDNEKGGQTLICLHGHFGTASNLSFMNSVFKGRVLIPDLRGHGLSDHASSYTKDNYLKDLEDFINALNIENPIILGHSLGGITAIRYAAKHQNVKMLIIEDIGTVVNSSNEFLNKFPVEFDSIYDVNKTFIDNLERPISTYFMESLYYDVDHWRFRFNYQEMIQSQKELNGEYWEEWRKVNCPVLLMKGGKSWASKEENMQEMIKMNGKSSLIVYPNAGHGIHDDEREKFCVNVNNFIENNISNI